MGAEIDTLARWGVLAVLPVAAACSDANVTAVEEVDQAAFAASAHRPGRCRGRTEVGSEPTLTEPRSWPSEPVISKTAPWYYWVPQDGATNVSTSPFLLVDLPEGAAVCDGTNFRFPDDLTVYVDGEPWDFGNMGMMGGSSEGSCLWAGLYGYRLDLPFSTKHSWYVELSFGGRTIRSQTWTFTTKSRWFTVAPTILPGQSPADGATGVPLSTRLDVPVADSDYAEIVRKKAPPLMVSYYDAVRHRLLGRAPVSYSTPAVTETIGPAMLPLDNLRPKTTYFWYAVADDGICSVQSETWSFTTGGS